MNHDNGGLGGSISVDGEYVEVDLAEFGWPADRAQAAGGGPADSEDEGRVRLQKALAHAGVAARRACESLITSGRVTVNGEVELELGSRIDPETDEVRVDGVVVQLDVSKRYFVLNKPTGVVSTMSDEHGRPDLREFTDQIEDRLYNVGRLDTDTSGLLILTNDGDLAHKLAHPSFGVSKTYVAKVRGRVTPAIIQQLKYGIELKDGPIRADHAKILQGSAGKNHSLVEITLHSGRNRIVRRMLAEVGHPVEELVRRQFGPLHIGTLRVGEMRELVTAERGALLSVAEGDGAPSDDSGYDAETGERTEKYVDRGRGQGQKGAMKSKGSKNAKGAKGKPGADGAGARRESITAGRPGDGKGARGMRGVAARGNPHGRRSSSDTDETWGGPKSSDRSGGAGGGAGRDRDRDDRRGGSGYGDDRRGGSGRGGSGRGGNSGGYGGRDGRGGGYGGGNNGGSRGGSR